MTNIEIFRYKQRLDYLFDQIRSFSDNTELQAQWARYLCILVAGFTETSVQAILNEYVRNKAAPSVASYAFSRLKRFTNPKMEDILTLLGFFDSKWRDNTENFAEGKLKEAVDSIMAQRNLIAHGNDTGISYVRIKDYYERIIKLIDYIENTCA
ncbi:HEPN domain-containing protein [Chloroflexota bacterium]